MSADLTPEQIVKALTNRRDGVSIQAVKLIIELYKQLEGKK